MRLDDRFDKQHPTHSISARRAQCLRFHALAVLRYRWFKRLASRIGVFYGQRGGDWAAFMVSALFTASAYLIAASLTAVQNRALIGG